MPLTCATPCHIYNACYATYVLKKEKKSRRRYIYLVHLISTLAHHTYPKRIYHRKKEKKKN